MLLPRNLSATIRGAKSRALALPDWMLQAPLDRLQHIKRAGGRLAAPILQSKPGRSDRPPKWADTAAFRPSSYGRRTTAPPRGYREVSKKEDTGETAALESPDSQISILPLCD